MYKREATFRFLVDDFKAFSRGHKKRLSRPEFIRGLPWKIVVQPEGSRGRRALGFYLQCNTDSDSKSWSCSANASFRILLPNGVSSHEKELSETVFSNKNNCWGFHFNTFSELLNPKNGFVKYDTLMLEVDMRPDIASGLADKYKPEARFRFSIDDCKDLARSDEERLSPPEFICGLPWHILVKPEGPRDRRTLALYIQCNAEADFKCFARATLRILSKKRGKPNREFTIAGRIFTPKRNNRGQETELFSVLLNPQAGLIKDGIVTLEACVSADAPHCKEVEDMTPKAPYFHEKALKKTLTQSLHTFAWDVISPPAFLCSRCNQIIGCELCVKPILMSKGASCPWCRQHWAQGVVQEVKGLDDFLANLRLHDQ